MVIPFVAHWTNNTNCLFISKMSNEYENCAFLYFCFVLAVVCVVLLISKIAVRNTFLFLYSIKMIFALSYPLSCGLWPNESDFVVCA